LSLRARTVDPAHRNPFPPWSLNGIFGPLLREPARTRASQAVTGSGSTAGDRDMQVIGIDVAKATFDIALPLGQGKYRTRGKLGNTAAGWEQLLAWRQAHAPEAAVGMEATGIYHE